MKSANIVPIRYYAPPFNTFFYGSTSEGAEAFMAAQDGTFRDGAYHFNCESCGGPATARRAHARTCSPACAARLRRRRERRAESTAVANETSEFRFYLSRRKLEASLRSMTEGGLGPELVVAFHRAGGGPELALLRIEETHQDDGGLVCSISAPYDPFPPSGTLPESS
jgi:hypothetical protein